MRDPIGHQVLCTADEVVERIRFVEQLAVTMPRDTTVTASSDLRLRDHPAPLHCSDLDQVKALVQRDAVAAVAFHNDPVAPVHQKRPLFEEKIHRDLRAVVRRDH